MSKIIVECPTCQQHLRIPGNRNIIFTCTKCSQELSHNPTHTKEPVNIKTVDEDFKPSNFRIFIHVVLGAFVGAPIGAAVVGAVGAVVGSTCGYYQGFFDTLRPFNLFDILVKSVNVIGQGAATLSSQWIPYGAKFGPWVFAILGFFLSLERWGNHDSSGNPSD